MKNNLSANYIKFGQIGLGLSLLICLIIIPKYFFSLDQGGVSNYGTDDRTRILFTIGFGIASLSAFLSALYLPARLPKKSTMKSMLLILSALYLAVLLTTFPYKINDFYRGLHEKSAIMLFVFMVIFALWIRFATRLQNLATKKWFLVFGLGILLSALTLFGVIHLLFTAQIVSGTAFAMIVISVVKSG